MKNNFYLTLSISVILSIAGFVFLPFGIVGFAFGVLYAQTIEWFVHGWIQHHPFKIFRAYRMNHNYHHAYPTKPLAVQPIQYYLIGSIFLLAPFYWLDGFIAGYLFMYVMINVIHYDLHSHVRMLPNFIWRLPYFKFIESHHHNHHHTHRHDGVTTYSVTNPFLDYLFSAIKVTTLNNFIAKKLKI